MIITVRRYLDRGCPKIYYVRSDEILGFGYKKEAVTPPMEENIRTILDKIVLVFKNGQEWDVVHTEELEEQLLEALERPSFALVDVL